MQGVQSRRYEGTQEVGDSGANRGLFLGPSLSGNPGVAPGEWRKGRACLALELFHLLCKDQISNGNGEGEKMKMRMRMRNDGGVGPLDVCVT